MTGRRRAEQEVLDGGAQEEAPPVTTAEVSDPRSGGSSWRQGPQTVFTPKGKKPPPTNYLGVKGRVSHPSLPDPTEQDNQKKAS